MKPARSFPKLDDLITKLNQMLDLYETFPDNDQKELIRQTTCALCIVEAQTFIDANNESQENYKNFAELVRFFLTKPIIKDATQELVKYFFSKNLKNFNNHINFSLLFFSISSLIEGREGLANRDIAAEIFELYLKEIATSATSFGIIARIAQIAEILATKFNALVLDGDRIEGKTYNFFEKFIGSIPNSFEISDDDIKELKAGNIGVFSNIKLSSVIINHYFSNNHVSPNFKINLAKILRKIIESLKPEDKDFFADFYESRAFAHLLKNQKFKEESLLPLLTDNIKNKPWYEIEQVMLKLMKQKGRMVSDVLVQILLKEFLCHNHIGIEAIDSLLKQHTDIERKKTDRDYADNCFSEKLRIYGTWFMKEGNQLTLDKMQEIIAETPRYKEYLPLFVSDFYTFLNNWLAKSPPANVDSFIDTMQQLGNKVAVAMLSTQNYISKIALSFYPNITTQEKINLLRLQIQNISDNQVGIYNLGQDLNDLFQGQLEIDDNTALENFFFAKDNSETPEVKSRIFKIFFLAVHNHESRLLNFSRLTQSFFTNLYNLEIVNGGLLEFITNYSQLYNRGIISGYNEPSILFLDVVINTIAKNQESYKYDDPQYNFFYRHFLEYLCAKKINHYEDDPVLYRLFNAEIRKNIVTKTLLVAQDFDVLSQSLYANLSKILSYDELLEITANPNIHNAKSRSLLVEFMRSKANISLIPEKENTTKNLEKRILAITKQDKSIPELIFLMTAIREGMERSEELELKIIKNLNNEDIGFKFAILINFIGSIKQREIAQETQNELKEYIKTIIEPLNFNNFIFLITIIKEGINPIHAQDFIRELIRHKYNTNENIARNLEQIDKQETLASFLDSIQTEAEGQMPAAGALNAIISSPNTPENHAHASSQLDAIYSQFLEKFLLFIEYTPDIDLKIAIFLRTFSLFRSSYRPLIKYTYFENALAEFSAPADFEKLCDRLKDHPNIDSLMFFIVECRLVNPKIRILNQEPDVEGFYNIFKKYFPLINQINNAIIICRSFISNHSKNPERWTADRMFNQEYGEVAKLNRSWLSAQFPNFCRILQELEAIARERRELLNSDILIDHDRAALFPPSGLFPDSARSITIFRSKALLTVNNIFFNSQIALIFHITHNQTKSPILFYSPQEINFIQQIPNFINANNQTKILVDYLRDKIPQNEFSNIDFTLEEGAQDDFSSDIQQHLNSTFKEALNIIKTVRFDKNKYDSYPPNLKDLISGFFTGLLGLEKLDKDKEPQFHTIFVKYSNEIKNLLGKRNGIYDFKLALNTINHGCFANPGTQITLATYSNLFKENPCTKVLYYQLNNIFQRIALTDASLVSSHIDLFDPRCRINLYFLNNLGLAEEIRKSLMPGEEAISSPYEIFQEIGQVDICYNLQEYFGNKFQKKEIIDESMAKIAAICLIHRSCPQFLEDHFFGVAMEKRYPDMFTWIEPNFNIVEFAQYAFENQETEDPTIKERTIEERTGSIIKLIELSLPAFSRYYKNELVAWQNSIIDASRIKAAEPEELGEPSTKRPRVDEKEEEETKPPEAVEVRGFKRPQEDQEEERGRFG